MAKQLLLVSLSVALVAALLCGFAAGNCEPFCPSPPPPTRMVADPLDCTRYYLCLGDDNLPSDSSIACPTGESFDPTTFACKFQLSCLPSCDLQFCHLQCNTAVMNIFDPNNCSIFYQCVGGLPIGPFVCPVHLPYFDGQSCGTDKSTCCSDPCLAYCFEEDMEIPDPHDCTRYYICTGTGPATEKEHQTCSSGSNFDVSTGRCVAGAPCNIPCGKTTAPGESTTTPTPNCEESMTCTAVGQFPKCMTCDQQFFNCPNIGQSAIVETCPESYVFNTDPTYPYCVIPSDCPHHPLYKVHQPLH
ncbi:uncharacterized protein [Procambarus clarkii]|uniref:uncharacterized protein n=1 Tax=Procambarus clarkii TaxID=6728 RepID=UPI0037436987